MYLDSSDLELVDDGSNTDQTVGMRFAGVAIPHGATIIDAYVQFQVDETDSDPTSLEIRGHVADDAPAFSSASGDISTRTTTVTYVAWSPPPWTSVGAAGADQRTPDLSEMIQEIIDQVEWSPGNALAITITGSGERTAESYEAARPARRCCTSSTSRRHRSSKRPDRPDQFGQGIPPDACCRRVSM